MGVCLLWNGAADEFSWSESAYDILLPAFESTLLSLQPPVQLPQNVSKYSGLYSINGNVVAQIKPVVFDGKNQLDMAIAGIGSFFLEYITPHKMRVYIPPMIISCMSGDSLAFADQYVLFKLDSDQNALQFTIPGLIYGVNFERA